MAAKVQTMQAIQSVVRGAAERSEARQSLHDWSQAGRRTGEFVR
jgi:hypothetical protein